MNVKSALLNGHLMKEVYVEKLPGFEIAGQQNKTYRLKKADNLFPTAIGVYSK